MDNNYMKTILSGVKEWTENLTDDAKDKANNALEQANKSIDKALFVVNITQNSDRTLSADKTFAEIVKVYNEKKYNIVANFMGVFIVSLSVMERDVAMFSGIIEDMLVLFGILSDNTVTEATRQLATTTSKLPNPYPLTFTGAVSETYDGSSAKTIEIPSGGGEVIIASSTAGSTKKFKITVDDSGTITATEVV